MHKNKAMSIILNKEHYKVSSVLFILFLACVGALFILSYIFEKFGFGFENIASLILMLFLQPAVMINRWFFEIPGANLDYHYYLALGITDIIGLAIFYFLVCHLFTLIYFVLKNRRNSH